MGEELRKLRKLVSFSRKFDDSCLNCPRLSVNNNFIRRIIIKNVSGFRLRFQLPQCFV